ncbi:MAG: DUF4878 domain-containing protein [Gordonia sp. (in: high G+C Gram-positive bacteria)]|jgi:hypothetical protein|nr:DUF4878 domain-containing protein [Gordonia sp. (in: high G+C Gram-positive bacteria)]
MSAKQPDSTDVPAEEQTPKTWRDALPFIIAFVVVLLAVGFIGIRHWTNPAEERLTDSAQIQNVVNDMYTARNSLDYEKYRSTQCEKNLADATFPKSLDFANQNRADRDRDGKLIVPGMEVEVSGERAAVTVTEKRENKGVETKTELTLVKQGDQWRVCAA